MTNPIQAIRGMNDILPTESFLWQHVEHTLRSVLKSYGYAEIRSPIVEKTELFKRSIGEATDIVEKEMYTFLDRGDDSLTLRPEGTACCIRAALEHGLLHNQIQRLWYMGPYFRYERPQKGRYRQFHQLGVEVFGLEGPDADAELILLSATMLAKLGLSSKVVLHLNSLGSVAARARYREHLVDYFSKHRDQLDEDSQRRLTTNPLRILDSKNPAMQDLILQAPKLIDHLDEESAAHFATLQAHLKQLQIPFIIDPRLVRGLDYYTKTVFEWVTHELGAQGAVCAGGRYDGLVEELGGKATPSLGFAMGLERLILLLQTENKISEPQMDFYFIVDGDAAFQKASELANQLRDKIPRCAAMVNCGPTSFKNQFKKADKSGAKIALILGPEELAAQSISIKYLREDKPQITVRWDNLLSEISC